MFDLGRVMGLQVAENSQKPGTGRIIAAVTSLEDREGIVNNILWNKKPQIFEATLRRFPDLLLRPGWAEYANELADDRRVVEELALQVREHVAEGGSVAMWDAPTTLARLEKYGFKTPAHIIDLRVMNRLMIPSHRGHRTPETMALRFRVQADSDLVSGLEREAQTLQHLGEVVRSLVKRGQFPDLPEQPTNWEELNHLQMVAAAEQSAGLLRWMKAQKKPTETVLTGWPVWDSR